MLRSILTGLVIAGVMALMMLKISMNLQLVLWIGALMFFLGGLFNASPRHKSVYQALVIVGFFSILLAVFILNEIPSVWYFIVIYFVSAMLGLVGPQQLKILYFSLPLMITMLSILTVKIIPNSVERDLTTKRYDKLPEFTLVDLLGDTIRSSSLKGKVVVIDFFGTWCAPCIQELKELDKVKNAFQNINDVQFYVVNADLAGDTPEKFQSFVNKNLNYSFHFAYDHGGEVYNLLNPNKIGLPSLLIVDKNQYVRFQHMGYNAAETQFHQSMIRIINEFRNETL